MSITRFIAVVASAAAVFAAPSVALAVGPPANPGGDHRPATTPSQSKNHPTPSSNAAPEATAPAADKAKAYGKHCQGQSKKHVAGEKGTAFSRCVTAMAKAATGKTDSARAACAEMSKKHTPGKRGTPYSRCVNEAAKLIED